MTLISKVLIFSTLMSLDAQTYLSPKIAKYVRNKTINAALMNNQPTDSAATVCLVCIENILIFCLLINVPQMFLNSKINKINNKIKKYETYELDIRVWVGNSCESTMSIETLILPSQGASWHFRSWHPESRHRLYWGQMGDKILASNLKRKYTCRPTQPYTWFTQVHIFFQLSFKYSYVFVKRSS